MDIFLVPVGRNRHELYCEVKQADDPVDVDEPSTGWMRRQVARFRTMLADAEEERVRSERGERSDKRGLARWVMARLAETIAEQRLLWHLRGADAACLVHPASQVGFEAMRLARAQLVSDAAKHRRWLVIDTAITCVTGPVFFMVPGPNIISWFFAFRALGHLYALRGARRALGPVRWTTRPSDDLETLRGVLSLDGSERRARLEEIADALGLAALSGFVERVARRAS